MPLAEVLEGMDRLRQLTDRVLPGTVLHVVDVVEQDQSCAVVPHRLMDIALQHRPRDHFLFRVPEHVRFQFQPLDFGAHSLHRVLVFCRVFFVRLGLQDQLERDAAVDARLLDAEHACVLLGAEHVRRDTLRQRPADDVVRQQAFPVPRRGPDDAQLGRRQCPAELVQREDRESEELVRIEAQARERCPRTLHRVVFGAGAVVGIVGRWRYESQGHATRRPRRFRWGSRADQTTRARERA